MGDARIVAAQGRYHLTRAVLAEYLVDEAPTLVRRFLVEDVPHLFTLLHQADIGHHHSPADRIVETVRMAELLPQLVHLARLADEATANGADPALWKARESDLREGMAGLCPHRLRLLLEVAVRALSETGWTGEPTRPSHPPARWLAPEAGWEPGS